MNAAAGFLFFSCGAAPFSSRISILQEPDSIRPTSSHCQDGRGTAEGSFAVSSSALCGFVQ